MTRSVLPLLLTALLMASFSASGRDLNQDEALQLTREGRIMPLEQLMQAIARLYPQAQLLEVDLEEHHGRYLYDIDLLTAEGVARELELDAHTGHLLQDKEDD